MLRCDYHPSPNPAKVALCLEEMGLDYEPVPVDVRRGEQFSEELTAVNPNAKTPALVDPDNGARVFDSNAILLYPADRTGRFLPEDTLPARGPLLSRLMFIATGVGPHSGQAVHLTHFAPEPNAYAAHRYRHAVMGHYAILEERLAAQRYLLGGHYTIVDIAFWGWARPLAFIMGDNIWQHRPNVKRLVDAIGERPAAQRTGALPERFAFKQEVDEDARRHMFPQNFSEAV